MIITSKFIQCGMKSIYSRGFDIKCSMHNWTSIYSIKLKVTDNWTSSQIIFYNNILTIFTYATFRQNSHCKFKNASFVNVNLKHAILRIFYFMAMFITFWQDFFVIKNVSQIFWLILTVMFFIFLLPVAMWDCIELL